MRESVAPYTKQLYGLLSPLNRSPGDQFSQFGLPVKMRVSL
jgi:hypothetical protein